MVSALDVPTTSVSAMQEVRTETDSSDQHSSISTSPTGKCETGKSENRIFTSSAGKSDTLRTDEPELVQLVSPSTVGGHFKH